MDMIFHSKSLCRICLEDGADLSLFEEDEDTKLYLKIMACSTVKITEEDTYPRRICPLCYSMLDTAYKFKQKCESTDVKLRNFYIKSPVKEEFLDLDDFPVADIFSDNDNILDINYEQSEDTELVKSEVKCETVHKPSKVKRKKLKLKKIKKEAQIIDEKGLELKKKKVIPRFKSKYVTNNIASSLLEGKCVWNGQQWRFERNAPPSEEMTMKEVEQVKLHMEREKLEKSKKRKLKFLKLKKEIKPQENLCDTCGQVFRNRYRLNVHTRVRHLNIAYDFFCPDKGCGKSFKFEHYMRRHYKRMHSEKKECICNECGKQYSFLSSLKEHLKIHAGTESWKQCMYCPQKYRTQKSVNIHIRSVHTGERPCACTMCDSAFFHPDYLKEHMRLHTGETPFKCPICKRGYAQRGNMKSHMKQHKMSELDDVTKAGMKPNYLKLLRNC